MSKVLAFQAVRTAKTKALDIFENAFTKLKTSKNSAITTTAIDNTIQNNINNNVQAPNKNMAISRLALPFQTDVELREEYVNHQGDLRLGLLLEDADALCGFAAYKHCSDMQHLPSIVTASMDRLTLSSNKSLMSNQDLQLLASVTATGTSSMNVDLDIATISHNPKSVVTASFTFVARSSIDYHSVKVPKIVARKDNQREHTLYSNGLERQNLRKKDRATSLNRLPPNTEEQKLLHELFTSYKPGTTLIKRNFNLEDGDTSNNFKQREIVDMERRNKSNNRCEVDEIIRYKIRDTKMGSINICHPQMRNIHNKVFGGYLMRKAYEIAWTNANLVIGDPNIYLMELDDISFRHPVEIGSILEFQARSVYSTDATLSISVHADVINPKTKEKKRTNTFEFIFGIKDTNVNVDDNNSYKSVTNNSVHIPEIIPRTYEEGIAYLTARRNLNNMNNGTNLINLDNEEHDDDVLFDVKHYLTKIPAI
jgi:acyl-coenzyme A thioesterase 9